MDRLTGKVALITGAAQGMGAAHATAFVAEGAKVILTDVREEQGRALAVSLGPNAVFVRHDVTSSDSWAHAVSTGEAAFGRITVLVNNAGIIGAIKPTEDMTDADFAQICDVNMTGVFLGVRTVLPSMVASGGGSIVNISSTAGIVAHLNTPSIAYVGSKFAVRGMTKFIAAEYGDRNIRANSIHPGYTRTPMMREATDDNGRDANKLIPLRRFGEPSDVANLAVFLASDESAYITGAEHVIDGGLTAI